MTKATSPIRLQADLMQAASQAGERLHRSTAQQIEYWASIGRKVTQYVDPDSLLEVSAGLAQIRVEPIATPTVNPDHIFAALEHDRESGTLAATIPTASVRYQSSTSHPGYLEQINADGEITVGQFSNGIFTPINASEMRA